MLLTDVNLSPYVPTTVVGLIAVGAFYTYNYFKNRNDNKLKEIQSAQPKERLVAMQMYLNELGVTVDTDDLGSTEKLALIKEIIRSKTKKQLISAIITVLLAGCVTFLIWSKYNANPAANPVERQTDKVDTTHAVVKAITSKLKQEDSAAIRNQTQPQNNTVHTAEIKPGPLQAAVKASDSTNTAVITQLNKEPLEQKNAVSISKVYPVQWFKENYSVQFDNILVHLYRLDKQEKTIIVQICHVNMPWVCSDQIEDRITINLNEPHDFSFNHVKYQLFLRQIDHGGKNPFTLAAYVSLQILN